LKFNENLGQLLNNLQEIIISMQMTPQWPKRPTCGQVLNTRREWIIDRNVVKEWTEFDSFAIKLMEMKTNFSQNF